MKDFEEIIKETMKKVCEEKPNKKGFQITVKDLSTGEELFSDKTSAIVGAYAIGEQTSRGIIVMTQTFLFRR